MKKLYKLTLLLLVMAWSTSLMATDYMVNGAGTTAVNGTYIPDGTNFFGAPRWKLSGGSYYLHSDGGSTWVINDNGDFPFGGYYENYSQSPFNQNIPPFTGWTTGEMGSPPAPTVGLAGPSLSYSSGTFTESSANDGNIDNSTPVIITHNNFEGGTFTGTNGDNFVTDGKIIVSNLPAGLTAVITLTSSTTLSVTITGTAPSHNNVNDISNLTFAFQNSAFSTNDASAISNSTKSDLMVDFNQEYYVASSGGDFTTIAAAIAVAGNGDVINVSAETFTEVELVVNKNITVRGQGADVTIIQADVTPNTAAHRVFNISSKIIATIENVTIRHGKTTSDGGGINLGYQANLVLNNSTVCFNKSSSWGGGIFNGGTLTITNCAINDNNGQPGGGIWNNGGCILDVVNTTITGNSSTENSGGGIYSSSLAIISLTNCTIAYNTDGGIFLNGTTMTISNTIIAGNTTSDYHVFNNVTLIDNGNNIIQNQTFRITPITSYFSAATDILYNYNADGTTSSSWNRNNAALANQNLNISSTLAANNTLNGTQTLALSSGSFAIDAGTDVGAPTTDQRGFYRNGTTDIGAYEYDGIPFAGSGTAGSPYEISNLDELANLSLNSSFWAAGIYFIQTADIDASATSGWDGGAGWTPIGNITTSFTGSYDGQGHTIDGLFINRPSENYMSLFGSAVGAVFENISATNVNFTGLQIVAGLVAQIDVSSTVNNCSTTGTVNATGNSYAGGLVAYCMSSIISNSHSSCSVTGINNTGGLIGILLNSNVSNSYSTGSVTAIASYIGGFVGSISNLSTISMCYATGSVSGGSGAYVGGFAGSNASVNSIISNCFAIGSVTGTNQRLGGLTGLNVGTVSNCFASGSVTPGILRSGGLNGSNAGTTTNSFWDTETSGYATSYGGTGKTTAEMKTQSTFTDAGWDFSAVWSISSGYNNGYPNLDGEWTILTWTGTSSTDWNLAANWDVNAVPGIGDNVVIPGSLTNYPVIAYGENGSCNDLAINSGGELKVDHGGSLITNGNITNNGTFAIDLLISQNKWHMVSSPITGATANTFLGDYLQNWDEPTATWSDITDPATVLVPTRGYSLWAALKFGDTYTFTGTPNTGNQNAAITYTNHGGTTYDGANLLGNPYPSSIDWSGLDDTWGAVYYWNGTAYVSWNNGSGSGVQYIPPMQGFFVVAAASGTFNLTNNNRTHSGAASYYKSSGSISNGLVLEATGDTYNDELYLKLNEEAASGFELTRDAWKLPSNTPGISQLWSVCPEGNLSIDVRPYQEVVPLGFSNDVAGNYGISIKEMADLTSVILEDTKENTFTDLTKGAYHFKWDLTDDENRFKIHLGITGIQTPSQAESVLIYTSGQDLYLRPVEGQSNGTLTLTDMAGRSVFQKQVQVSGLTSVPVNLVSGIYLVSFRTNTETLVKKVVIQ